MRFDGEVGGHDLQLELIPQPEIDEGLFGVGADGVDLGIGAGDRAHLKEVFGLLDDHIAVPRRVDDEPEPADGALGGGVDEALLLQQGHLRRAGRDEQLGPLALVNDAARQSDGVIVFLLDLDIGV